MQLAMPQAEASRAEKYPNLVSPRRLKALVVRLHCKFVMYSNHAPWTFERLRQSSVVMGRHGGVHAGTALCHL